MKELKYYLLERKYKELLSKCEYYKDMIDMYNINYKETFDKMLKARKALKRYENTKH